MPDTHHHPLFEGLKALAESTFPKHCSNCGRFFENAEQFLQETHPSDYKSADFQPSATESGKSIVEIYRTCFCGATLMSFFSERRDVSPNGIRRREKFGELLEILVNQGVERDTARAELLKMLHGEHSDLLEHLLEADVFEGH